MIKTIFLTLFLITAVLSAKEHRNLPYDVSASLLQSIDNDAIILGTGNKVVYVFIDPLCPHSRKFVSMVSKTPRMLSKYQYRFLLYSIPRLKSTDVVSAIYSAENSIEILLRIMIDKKVSSSYGNEKTRAMVDRISKVAETLNVYKRPYIFIIK